MKKLRQKKLRVRVTGTANIAMSSTGYRGMRYWFHRYIGCTEDHTAAACKDFRGLDAETKKKALEESELCTFCLRHSASSECYGKGLNSKLACQVLECEGQHTEKLHEMMASLNASVNMVVDKQEEEEGYINVARGEYCEESREGWRTPYESWLEMEAMEDAEETVEMF